MIFDRDRREPRAGLYGSSMLTALILQGVVTITYNIVWLAVVFHISAGLRISELTALGLALARRAAAWSVALLVLEAIGGIPGDPGLRRSRGGVCHSGIDQLSRSKRRRPEAGHRQSCSPEVASPDHADLSDPELDRVCGNERPAALAAPAAPVSPRQAERSAPLSSFI